MAEPFLSEIRIFSFNFPPKGWALCNGQLLPINQNQALFSLLGTVYGGDGRTTFGLPDLRDRLPIGVGNSHTLGERGGEVNHTLSLNELPTHTHNLAASDAQANSTRFGGANFASSVGGSVYSTSQASTVLDPQTITAIGGSQPHTNTMPILVLNFCIALQGIFPSQT